jgi:hypothetical protein
VRYAKKIQRKLLQPTMKMIIIKMGWKKLTSGPYLMVFNANALDQKATLVKHQKKSLPPSLKLVNAERFTRGTTERVVFRTWAYTLS